MNQAERDRLLTLKKVQKSLITQREAAEELSLSVRHVKRLMKALKSRGERLWFTACGVSRRSEGWRP